MFSQTGKVPKNELFCPIYNGTFKPSYCQRMIDEGDIFAFFLAKIDFFLILCGGVYWIFGERHFENLTLFKVRKKNDVFLIVTHTKV